MLYLDPKNDLTFKKIFGKHPRLTKSFLNALLGFEGDRTIEILTIADPNLVPENPLGKYTIVDVRCTDKKGRQFIIEMQMLWTHSFKSRVLFNACKNYITQLKKNETYDQLQPVYSVCLVNQNFMQQEDVFYHPFGLLHQDLKGEQMEGMHFLFIELQKFKAQSIRDKRMLVLWLRFLTEIEDNTSDIPADLLQNDDIRAAVELLEESAFTQEEREYYDQYWDQIRTEKTLMVDSLEKGKIEGKMEGKMEIACKMLKKGIAIDLVSEVTGLSVDTVANLKCP